MSPLKLAMIAAVMTGGEWTAEDLATEIGRRRKFTSNYCRQLVDAGYLTSVRKEAGTQGGMRRHVFVWTGKESEAFCEAEQSDRELDDRARNDGKWWPRADGAVAGAMFRMVAMAQSREQRA